MKFIKFTVINLVGIALVGFPLWFFNIFPFNKFIVNTDGSNPNNFPRISFLDITSGRLEKFLTLENDLGNLGNIPSNADSLNLRTTTPGFLEIMKVSLIDPNSPKPKVPPYRIISYYKTRYKNSEYLVFVQKWKNIDGSFSFLPLLLVNDGIIKSDGSISPSYQNIYNNYDKFMSPYVDYESVERCRLSFGPSPDYCTWFYKNKHQYDKNIKEWIDSGNLPKKMSRLPFMFRMMSFIKE